VQQKQARHQQSVCKDLRLEPLQKRNMQQKSLLDHRFLLQQLLMYSQRLSYFQQ